MMSKVTGLIIFVLGAATGSIVTWQFAKKKKTVLFTCRERRFQNFPDLQRKDCQSELT